MSQINNTHRARINIIQKEIENSVSHKLSQCESIEEKRALVVAKNPNHYIFGEKRRVWKDYLTYEENMEGYKA